MFLAIDVGNTQATLGLFDGSGSLVHGWRMATSHTDTSDSLHARLWSYFAKDGLSLGCVDADGMPIEMAQPQTVGADRIANAIAARRTYGDPVIVVDFGTATNIDVVDQLGRYRGGAISPGLMLSAGALFSKAARLASIPVEAPAHALGDTTETAIQSGLVIGAAAQAEGLVARIRSELGPGAERATVVGTGGLARTVSRATSLFDVIDPDLTLRGIREIWMHEGGRHEGA